MRFLTYGNNRGREYSLREHTQFMMLSMVLNHLASIINDFLRRAIVFLLSLERRCFHTVVVPHP
jgi:hypothetical protein